MMVIDRKNFSDEICPIPTYDGDGHVPENRNFLSVFHIRKEKRVMPERRRQARMRDSETMFAWFICMLLIPGFFIFFALM